MRSFNSLAFLFCAQSKIIFFSLSLSPSLSLWYVFSSHFFWNVFVVCAQKKINKIHDARWCNNAICKQFSKMILTKLVAKNSRAQFRCTIGKNNGTWNSGRHFECFHGSFDPRQLKRIQFRSQMSEAKSGLEHSDFPNFYFCARGKTMEVATAEFQRIFFSYTRTFFYVISFFSFFCSHRERVCNVWVMFNRCLSIDNNIVF